MLYSLYNYYVHSSLGFIDIVEDYCKRFYLKEHSQKELDSIMSAVSKSSKIDSLLGQSLKHRVVPTCDDFTATICGMFKFMFASNDTIIMATLLAEVEWVVTINDTCGLCSLDDCKKRFLQIFNKFQVYKEMTEEEYLKMTQPKIEKIEKFIEPTEPIKSEKPEKWWTLFNFAKEYGKMQVAPCINKETQEHFKMCVFTKYGIRTFVSFSSTIGELTPKEILDRKNELIVVEVRPDHYVLTTLIPKDDLPF